MRIEEIISGLDNIAREKQAKNAGLPDGWPLDTGLLDDETVLREAIAIIRTHPEAQPNEPLALENLREMKGPVVWLQCKYYSGWTFLTVHDDGDIFATTPDGEPYFIYTFWKYNGGLGAKLYRRPPKEETG